jgi:hypothetical protein
MTQSTALLFKKHSSSLPSSTKSGDFVLSALPLDPSAVVVMLGLKGQRFNIRPGLPYTTLVQA